MKTGGGWSNQFSELRRVVVIAPRVIGSTSAVTGTLDLLGAVAVELEIICGDVQTGASAALSFSIEHANASNFSDAEAVPDAMLIGLESGLDISGTNLIRRLGYKAATGKRYLRVTTTPGSHLYSQIQPVAAAGSHPQSWNPTTGFLNGAVIDTSGYEYVSLAHQFGTNTMSGKAVGGVVVQYGNNADGSDMSTITDYGLLDAGIAYVAAWQFTVATTNTIKRVGYIANRSGAKRYVRVRYEAIGATGGAIMVSSFAEKINIPTATSFGVVAMIRDRYTHQNTEQ